MRTPLGVWGALVLIFSLTWSEAAFGFGILLTDQPLVSSKIIASRTFLTVDSTGRTVQTTEIHFNRAQEGEFLWLLPVFTDGELTVGDCTVDFDQLQAISQPRVLLRHREASAGCSGESEEQIVVPDIGAHSYTGNPVEALEDPLVLDPFADRAELEAWLASQGRVVPVPGPATGLLDHYVNHSWNFVAQPVSSALTTGSLCVEATYNFRSSSASLLYLLPLKTLSASATTDSEVLLYVLDRGTARPYLDPRTDAASYYAVSINRDDLLVDSSLATNYADLFREAIDSRAAPAFVIEYSGRTPLEWEWLDPRMDWLTRLRIRLSPGDVPNSDTVGSDLALEVADDREIPRDYQIIIASAPRAHEVGLALATLTFVGICFLSRRRDGAGR